MMKCLKYCLATVAVILPAPLSAQSSDMVAQRIEQARSLAGPLYGPVQQHLCFIHSPEDEARLAIRRKAAVLQPTRVFDNFYYVGAEEVASWALVTSSGIILFDTLDNPDEAKTDVVEGLRKLGLDPNTIKYIVVTHGHGDHYGGAAYLKTVTGAKILASGPDTELMQSQKSGGGGPAIWKDLVPNVDQTITEGQTLTLGDTVVTFHITPGHTPGTVSSLFTVRDHGKSHTLAFWGGVGVPNRAAPLGQYLQSADNFARLAAASKADVAITNHPHADMTLEWVTQIHDAHPSANPLIVGPDGVARWFGVIKACAQAQQARLDAGIPPNSVSEPLQPNPNCGWNRQPAGLLFPARQQLTTFEK